jgi:hypothetical protein
MTSRLHTLFGVGAVLFASCAAAHAAITISTGTTQNMSCTGGMCTPTAANAVLNVSDLTTMLASGNVTVNMGALGSSVEDILVTAPFNWANASSLTLDAYRSVTVFAAVADNSSGAVSLVTNDGGSGGTLSFVSGGSLSFPGTSNGLSINGAAYTLVGNLSTLATDIASNAGGSYALAGNYNAAPDGTYSASPIATQFAGNFQGLGNTISNLSISTTGKNPPRDIGLFSSNGSSGVIANVVLQDADVDASGEEALAGGLVGQNAGVVSDTHIVGGIVTNTGRHGDVGGLSGFNSGTVMNSSASATVSGKSFSSAGGLVGSLGVDTGTIETSYATGGSKVSGDSSAGGLVGNIGGGTVENCYATGPAAGGFAGSVGGLAGLLQEQENVAMIGTSYSTGRVKSKTAKTVGGFLGQFDAGTISSSYWDTTTSKTQDPVGGSTKLKGVTGLTTKQFQTGLPTGFDPTIWAESPSINNGLPYLINNPPQ